MAVTRRKAKKVRANSDERSIRVIVTPIYDGGVRRRRSCQRVVLQFVSCTRFRWTNSVHGSRFQFKRSVGSSKEIRSFKRATTWEICCSDSSVCRVISSRNVKPFIRLLWIPEIPLRGLNNCGTSTVNTPMICRRNCLARSAACNSSLGIG